jgi:hypothetical protein
MEPEILQPDDVPPPVRAPEEAARKRPDGAQHGEAAASPASIVGGHSWNVREEGKVGSRETLGPDGFPADISFDPNILEGQGIPNNLPCPKTVPGGEDWLTVNFHVDFPSFDVLAEQLDRAQEAAAKGIPGVDELQFGEVRFIVASRGARQGRGDKSIHMRWRLIADNGLVFLLLNRAKSHETLPNVSVRATSLVMMQLGFMQVWQLMQYCVEAMGGEIKQNKISRVDPCIDLAGVSIDEFMEPFQQNWFVSRTRSRANYAVGVFMNEYMQGRRHTGFTFGKSPIMCRVYEKLVEARRDENKLAVLKALRWGGLPECATRVEFQIERTKLKQFGINSVEDWLELRGEIVEELTSNWLRLTAGPVDRNHADRAPLHSIWGLTRKTFAEVYGKASGQELMPLVPLEINASRYAASAVGNLRGMFARLGKPIADNYQFEREALAAIRDTIRERDMAAEVVRKELELAERARRTT